jgi:argininosuccinate synthase
VENPELIPPLERILQWCKPVEQTPDVPAFVQLDFVMGIPVAVNGEKKKLSDIVFELNKIGSDHGVGVTLLIEDRIVGLKVRGVYENPAAAVLIAAHKRLEMLVSTREENELKSFIDNKWAYLTYGAKWYDPVMYHIHAYINSQNKKVDGTVTVKLHKGNIQVVALKSPNSLFNASLATFNRDAKFNVNASAGFIEIYNLAQKTAYNVHNYENELGKN